MPDPGSAQELLRAAGLSADGPVLWGTPVPSRRPGVFVAELAAPLDAAPTDITTLRAWVDRVPGLLLDGERPTPTVLERRLTSFWLPGQRVLYIGRTQKTLSGRVAAAYATPLGDRRPHPGGHWLKTLRGLDRLRVWWAETDAPEEYEDALLVAFAGGVDESDREALPDGAVVLPWANLESVGGARRATGITGSLLENEATAASATKGSRGKAASAASGRTTTGTARRAGASAPGARRRTTSTGSSSQRGKPAAAPTHVTAHGLQALESELDQLRGVRRSEVITRVKNARELGDLRENADYEAARNEQSFLEGRIRAVEQLIKTAVVIGADHSGEVMLGSTVRVQVDDDEMTFRIVGSTEADPAAGRISNVSPVGKALVGHRAGDDVVAELPGRRLTYRIVEVS